MVAVRIFTDRSISPSFSLRQCADRYTFRAGRNLPDKEFRYLRTVIVTAAVYRGLSYEYLSASLTFRHWAGVSSHTLSYDFAETYVFGKQSPAPGFCSPISRHLFFRRYEAILPSSLERIIPYLYVKFTGPPVSVWSTCICLFRKIRFFLEVWSKPIFFHVKIELSYFVTELFYSTIQTRPAQYLDVRSFLLLARSRPFGRLTFAAKNSSKLKLFLPKIIFTSVLFYKNIHFQLSSCVICSGNNS